LDSGVQRESTVSFHYDPMLAKLIVWAESREATIDRMKRALSDFVLLGVRNNIEFLRRVISHPEFRQGNIDTHFLERHPELLHSPIQEPPLEALLAASLTAPSAEQKRDDKSPLFSDVWTS